VKTHLLTNKLHEGYVYLDVNKNCILDSLDTPYAHARVLFEKDDFRGLGFSDHTGRYALWLDTGRYKASAIPIYSPYSKSCTSQLQVSIDSSFQSTSKTEFLIQDTIDAPYLTVDISTPRVSRCFYSYYQVKYCNHGSQAASNVLLEVHLDPYLSYKSSTQMLTHQVDNKLTFQLDSLQVGACRSFKIYFGDDCKSELGQMHCTSAHIYPDSVFMEHLPHAKIDASCKSDTLIYNIQNRAADFPERLPYLISDGWTIVDTGSVFLLASQRKSFSYFTQNSKKAYQFVLAPKSNKKRLATTLYGCQDSASSRNMLFSPQYHHPYIESDCSRNRGSYDPNDKQVFPEGNGPDHHIVPNAPLEYIIRFQNTGTDTAYFINILDTLSLALDMGSLQLGSSSHSYRMEYMPPTDEGRQVLKFTFDPILLPDSGANLEASPGFVKYEILMKKNLPLGTRIENRAAIYFDYNDPVITNTTFLTLHLPDTNFNSGSTAIEKELSEFGSAFTLYPNPTDHFLHIDLGEEYQEVSIKVSNLLGQTIYTRHFARLRKTKLKLGEAAGIYLLTIQTLDDRATTMKVVKKGN
jgi:hypothetical protein